MLHVHMEIILRRVSLNPLLVLMKLPSDRMRIQYARIAVATDRTAVCGTNTSTSAWQTD